MVNMCTEGQVRQTLVAIRDMPWGSFVDCMCQNMQLEVDMCALQSMLQHQHLHLSRHACNTGNV